MRKTVFILTLVLSGIITMAQEESKSSVRQTGSFHKATVEQTGSLNYSEVSQKSINNEASVTQINYTDQKVRSLLSQTGSHNKGTVSQHHNGSNEGELSAIMHQNGDYNIAIQVQGPHDEMGWTKAIIKQKGNGNRAEQYQVKFGNDAEILQQGNLNSAIQYQDVQLPAEAPGSNNYAYLTQPGNMNIALQIQNGSSNKVWLRQQGNANLSLQTQNADNSIASVKQPGDNNFAVQNQDGARNFSEIEQHSDYNVARQDQTSDSPRPEGRVNRQNKAEIHQKGGFFGVGANVAIQVQETPGGDRLRNDAGIWQNGSGNYASQHQYMGYNNSKITQTGLSNSAITTQTAIFPN